MFYCHSTYYEIENLVNSMPVYESKYALGVFTIFNKVKQAIFLILFFLHMSNY